MNKFHAEYLDIWKKHKKSLICKIDTDNIQEIKNFIIRNIPDEDKNNINLNNKIEYYLSVGEGKLYFPVLEFEPDFPLIGNLIIFKTN